MGFHVFGVPEKGVTKRHFGIDTCKGLELELLSYQQGELGNFSINLLFGGQIWLERLKGTRKLLV